MLGRPVAHSLSPVLHRAAYAALGLNWSYEAIDCGPAELPAVLDERRDWAGFSCTMPLKRAALDLAGSAGTLAHAVGAANTLLPGPDGWHAENTDVAGIVAAVRSAGGAPATATVLGAGGTAQAAMAALAVLGITSCTVLVRDPQRSEQVLATADAVGVTVTVDRLAPDADALTADLILATVPAGAADALARSRWRPGQLVLDAVYDPWPTRLAAAVAAAGGTVLSGALLLLYQAQAQVELMTGVPAPLAAMRSALRSAAPSAGL